ncbi:MAG: hypothetical protein H6Q17_83 [Bacteroidetes bacterium]|nr:hypothetical protein [Bacteroidota bacterium]
MFRSILFSLFLCSVMTGFSQIREKPVISFATRIYDFGTIREEVGKVSHDFVFINTGKTPLVIQQVTASCGCTTPSWTKQPIAPGAQGKIAVVYTATGRPGIFTKTITVTNNSEENPVQLTIHGSVTPKPLSQSQAFPVDFGTVRLKSTLIPIGNIRKGTIKSIVVPVLNASNTNITLSFGSLPPHITVTTQPTTLAPGKESLLKISYNSALTDDWAFRNDPINLIVNSDTKGSKKNVLHIAAFISEDFSKLTPIQKRVAPTATLLTKEVKLGKAKTNGTLTGSFAIKNTGNSPLLIRKIFSDCNCISYQLPKAGIASGQTDNIRFVIKAGKLTGLKIENINLLTNSPSTTDLQLPISWETVR